METDFKEPIFYYNGDYSGFMNASKLAIDGILLSNNSVIPDIKVIMIEFSFPNSEIIIEAQTELTHQENRFYLKFVNIDNFSLENIKRFINSKAKSHISFEL